LKNIKIDDDVHALIVRNCTKDMTISDFLRYAVSGEPFVGRLKEVLPRTVAGIEANKKGGRRDLSVADDLVRVAQWIVMEHKRRVEGAVLKLERSK